MVPAEVLLAGFSYDNFIPENISAIILNGRTQLKAGKAVIMRNTVNPNVKSALVFLVVFAH